MGVRIPQQTVRLQHIRGLERFPPWVMERYPNMLSRVREQVKSERALGIGEEMGELDHWDDVCQDFEQGMGW